MHKATDNLISHCPCCSGKSYSDCCSQYIDGRLLPTTPEQLMRSRYTAYSLVKIDYIIKTMKGSALKEFDPESAKQWAQQVKWTRLKIRKSQWGKSRGFVEFFAYYLFNHQEHTLHEISEFHFEIDRWYYTGQKKGEK